MPVDVYSHQLIGFSKVDELSTELVSIVDSQNLDGIDINYVSSCSYHQANLHCSESHNVHIVPSHQEYCYYLSGTQAGQCNQRDTGLYATDA